MNTVRYDLTQLRQGSLCLVCGERADHRVDATVADHVRVDSPTIPLCDTHARTDRTRFVAATVVGALAKFAPVVVGYGLGRYADAGMAIVILATLAAAGVCFTAERALAPRLRPLCKIVARNGDDVDLEVLGDPPSAFLAGGPAPRAGNRVIDRTAVKPALSAVLAVMAAVVAGWQWSQARPLIWLDNPTEAEATVTINEVIHVIPADGKLPIRLRAGRHTVQIQTANQRMELPLEVSWGAPMLLATEPSCYGIGLALATTMQAEGQLFTLGSGEWRRVNCGS